MLFLSIIAIIFLFRKNKTELSTKSHALNYSPESASNQGITTLDSSGNLSYLSFPTGIIVVWYPTDSTMTSLSLVSTTVPKGWAICDGTKGTPDLCGRFVLMAQDSAYSIMSTGGAAKHTLTSAEMPSHDHMTAPNGGYGGCLGNGNKAYSGGGGADFGGGGSCFRTSAEGGNQPHNNMPPFYTLIYIMRL